MKMIRYFIGGKNNFSAGFLENEHACGDVPDFNALLNVGIDAAGGNVGHVERS